MGASAWTTFIGRPRASVAPGRVSRHNWRGLAVVRVLDQLLGPMPPNASYCTCLIFSDSYVQRAMGDNLTSAIENSRLAFEVPSCISSFLPRATTVQISLQNVPDLRHNLGDLILPFLFLI